MTSTPITLATVLVGISLGACGFDISSSAPPDAAASDAETLPDDAVVLGAGGAPVNLRTASKYAVLAKASISGTGATITGDVGIGPAAASYATGFSLVADASTEFSTSAQVTGKVYAADYGAPTPHLLIAAVEDMRLAYAEAAERPATTTDLSPIDSVLAAGVYHWNKNLDLAANVALHGTATDVWIFQIEGTLTLAADVKITLTGGALASNVFWQSSGAITLGATSRLEGVVLTATALTSGAGTTIHGRILASTDVTITGSTVAQP